MILNAIEMKEAIRPTAINFSRLLFLFCFLSYVFQRGSIGDYLILPSSYTRLSSYIVLNARSFEKAFFTNLHYIDDYLISHKKHCQQDVAYNQISTSFSLLITSNSWTPKMARKSESHSFPF